MCIRDRINDLREAIKTDDLARIQKGIEALQTASAAIYKAGPSAPSGESAPPETKDDGVVEGEYRQV